MDMNYQTKYKQIPIEVSIRLRYLHQDKGLTVPELHKRYPEYPRRSISGHSRKSVRPTQVDCRHENQGRHRLLNEHAGR